MIFLANVFMQETWMLLDNINICLLTDTKKLCLRHPHYCHEIKNWLNKLLEYSQVAKLSRRRQR